MKTLTDSLLYEQKKATNLPVVSLMTRQYGHPQKAGGSGGATGDGLQWGMFNWTKLYETATITPNYHGVAIAGDGSLQRCRLDGSFIKHQRIASPGPGSDFGAAWTNTINVIAPCAITARGAEVLIFASLTGNMQYQQSTDYGVTFGSTALIGNSDSGANAVAACHKSNGQPAVCGARDNVLWISYRIGAAWQPAYYFPAALVVEGLAMYHDGDWNIIALINSSSTLRLGRIVYGDGYRLAAGTWSTVEYLNTGRAAVEQAELLQQYLERLPPYSDFNAEAQKYTSYYQDSIRRRSPYPNAQRGVLNIRRNASGTIRHATYKTPVYREDWLKVSAILAARAIDNLDLDAPFIAQPSGAPPILSVYKQGDRWFFRLKPATDFYDADWDKAYRMQQNCPYGFAIACDSNYIWGTRANEVWRSPLPGNGWPTPTAGTGASEESQEISQGDIAGIEETIRNMHRSELEITLDNSRGTYSSLPSTHIKRGSRVEFAYGYRTTENDVADPNKYFIEDWIYDREPNLATVTLYCIDAWGLLEEYVIPGNQEFNLIEDTHSVYDIIEKLMQCIGGTLSYKSRSALITSLYPKMEVKAGQTGAGLLKELLELVPDVIYFNGLDAYLVYPQADDSPTYAFYFPGDS